MNTSRFSIVIPAWNEATTIERAIREIGSAFVGIDPLHEIIVVDDGSTDGTAEIVARQMPSVRVIRHPHNQGKGSAVRTGVLATRGAWILVTDADLSVSPNQVSRFTASLDTADILIGSRRVAGAEIAAAQSRQRDYAGRLFNLVIRWMTGLTYRDTQCGFKMFHQRARPLFESLQTPGWAFDVELLVRARQVGMQVREIPVTWHNGPRSRVRWRDAWTIFTEARRIGRLRT
jgi:dolichyl-phosphate beta-glucosyltransferase